MDRRRRRGLVCSTAAVALLGAATAARAQAPEWRQRFGQNDRWRIDRRADPASPWTNLFMLRSQGTLVLQGDLCLGGSCQNRVTRGAEYEHVIVVAKGGGDFATVSAAVAAIAAIGDASEANPYLVWVGPGTYDESLTLPAFTHLAGSGQETTIVRSSVGAISNPPTVATVILGQGTRVSDLSIVNQGAGAGTIGAAVLAPAGVQATLRDVTVRGVGTAGNEIHGLMVDGDGAGLVVDRGDVRVTGVVNTALWVANEAVATVRRSSLTALSSSLGLGARVTDGARLTLADSEVSATVGPTGVVRGIHLVSSAPAPEARADVRNAVISADGGSLCAGVLASRGFVAIEQASVVASDGADASAVEVGSETDVRIRGSSLYALGAGTTRALQSGGIVIVEDSFVEGLGSIAQVSFTGLVHLRRSTVGTAPSQVQGGTLGCDGTSDTLGRHLSSSCGTTHTLMLLGAAGQAVFRADAATYGNAPTTGSWGSSLCLGFAAGGANDNAARRLVYPFQLPGEARIVGVASELWDASATGSLASSLRRRTFGAAANAELVEALPATGNGGWQVVAEDVDHAVDPGASYFVQVDVQTDADMTSTCVGGHRITYELYGR